MDEYIIDVVIEGKADKLKTFCSSVYSAIDSMIGMDMVEDITLVTRTIDGRVWDIEDNMDINYLRSLRKDMDFNMLNEGLKMAEETYHDTTH